jgi:hypothetical protein
MDVDGDGEGDRDQLLEMIAASGGSIDNEVDELGALRVAGRYDDRPSVSETTKFIVQGKFPQPSDLSDCNEIGKSIKIAEVYALLEAEAHERGARIISLEEFLRDIGYERHPENATGTQRSPRPGTTAN